jgi:hypothetical protein
MRERKGSLLLWAAILASVTATALATDIVLPLRDTGWSVSFDERLKEQLGVHVLGVRPSQNAVLLELDKWFTGIKSNTGFDPIILSFNKDNLSTSYSRFIIKDEFIVNDTDTDWLDFHMLLSPGVVGFDNLTVPDGDKFADVDFYNNSGYTGLPVELDFSNGTVPHDPPSNYFQPAYWGGDIIVVTDPQMGTNGKVGSFILKEFPTPEPASFLLLLGTLLFGRRKWN